MWLSDSAGKVGEVSAAGSISMFTVPGNGAPQGMTAGPDGAMWFDQFSTGGIARVAIDGSSILSFPIPTASAQPRHIVQAPDGTLWFTEFGGNKIGRLQ
jgi:virginiamycin B lyase